MATKKPLPKAAKTQNELNALRAENAQLGEIAEQLTNGANSALSKLAVPAAYLEGLAQFKKEDTNYDATVDAHRHINTAIGEFKFVIGRAHHKYNTRRDNDTPKV